MKKLELSTNLKMLGNLGIGTNISSETTNFDVKYSKNRTRFSNTIAVRSVNSLVN